MERRQHSLMRTIVHPGHSVAVESDEAVRASEGTTDEFAEIEPATDG